MTNTAVDDYYHHVQQGDGKALREQAQFKYKIGGGDDQPFSAAALNADTTKIDLTTSGTTIAHGDTVTVSYTARHRSSQ